MIEFSTRSSRASTRHLPEQLPGTGRVMFFC